METKTEVSLKTETISSSNLELLKGYVNAGLSPVPVNIKTKRPYMNAWQKHRTTLSEIESWIKAGNTNFGIVCGEASGGLEIMDFDDYHMPGSYEEWRSLLTQSASDVLNTLPISRTQRGGYHVLYRSKSVEGNKKLARRPYDITLDGEPEHVPACGENCNGGDKCEAKKPQTFIETRGEGGQALEPPSLNYTRLQGDLARIPFIEDEIRNTFFRAARTLSKLEEKNSIFETELQLNLNESSRPGDTFNEEANWDQILSPHGWKKASKTGNTILWTRPGKKEGISASTNHYGNDQLYVFSTNAHPFESEKSYKKFTAYTLLNHKGDFTAAARELGSQQAVKLSEAIEEHVDQLPDVKDIETKLKKLFYVKKGAPKAIYKTANYLVTFYSAKTVGNTNNTRTIYIYRDGTYIPGINIIKSHIQKILGDVATTHLKNEVMETIKDLTWIDRASFTPNKDLINLKNGTYDLQTKTLLPHASERLFLNQIPVNYIAGAECPIFINFLTEILDEESVNLIQEWFGYCLYRAYFLKKALICLGERDTGKTTLFRVLEKFLHVDNISGVSLQKISSDRFALSNLYNKHANIYDDLSFKDINDNGTFKMLTGGGTVSAEVKFGDQFPFSNYAKLTFSCNKIPKITDTDDDAYFSRWLLVRFEHQTKKPDKFLVDKMTTEAELSGILNFALEGLYRLLKTQEFSYKKTPDEIKREMSMSASPLAQFVFAELEMVADPSVYITKDEMHQEFINYAKKMELPVISKEALGKSLPRYIKLSEGKKSIKVSLGKTAQVGAWVGVRFKVPKTKVVTQEDPSEIQEIQESEERDPLAYMFDEETDIKQEDLPW